VPEAVDFAVTHSLQPRFLDAAATEQAAAANLYAEQVKDRKYRARVEAEGMRFVPCVLDTFGAWCDTGLALAHRLVAKVQANKGGHHHGQHFFQGVSLAVCRGIARAILAREEMIDDDNHIPVTEMQPQFFEYPHPDDPSDTVALGVRTTMTLAPPPRSEATCNNSQSHLDAGVQDMGIQHGSDSIEGSQGDDEDDKPETPHPTPAFPEFCEHINAIRVSHTPARHRRSVLPPHLTPSSPSFSSPSLTLNGFARVHTTVPGGSATR
jgi:hypothetical protein